MIQILVCFIQTIILEHLKVQLLYVTYIHTVIFLQQSAPSGDHSVGISPRAQGMFLLQAKYIRLG